MAVYIDGQRRDQQLNIVDSRRDADQHLGLDRVGYDADSQRYTYRDPATGQYYEGDEGNRYGNVHPINPSSTTSPQASPLRWSQYPPPGASSSHDRYPAWRYFAPFAVIILLVLLLLFKYVSSGSTDDGPAMSWPAKPLECPEGFKAYTIEKGDTCWEVAEAHGRTVEDLTSVNVALDCDKLIPGKQLCV